jgi:glycosyltransferase involved in cell wall biosynthesis
MALRLREYLQFDAALFRKAVALLGLVAGSALSLAGKKAKAFSLFSKIHRSDCSRWADRFIERWLRSNSRKAPGGWSPLARIFAAHIEGMAPRRVTAKFFASPTDLLGTRALVLKSPGDNEKGVILIDYNYVLPLFAKLFDVPRIAEKYHVVLETTWTGYCDPDILCYSQFDFPVFVQASEPRDAALLRQLGSNLIPLSVGGNWWVDHRIFRALPGVEKDVDAIMIASWGRYKRHHRFFSALAQLRARGERLKAVLVGYPIDFTIDDILGQARYYGVEDQLEVYERLSPEEVNYQLNRAKVNIVWSRKEGFNRAVIEGMFAGVPCLLREGFNFGYRYPYINPQTGCFTAEKRLPEQLSWMVWNHQRFSPRDWVLLNMSCQKATEVIEEAVRKVATAAGEHWTGGLAVKVCTVNTMRYWNEADGERFRADYDFLRSALRGTR